MPSTKTQVDPATEQTLPYAQLKAPRVELPAPPDVRLERYQAVASAGQGWAQPHTVAVVPDNEAAQAKEPLKVLEEIFEPYNPDGREIKLGIVWDDDGAYLNSQELDAVFALLDPLWRGQPVNGLRVDFDGKVRFRDRPIRLVFGWLEDGEPRYYDKEKELRANAEFAAYAARVLLPAKDERLNISGGHRVFFGVVVDGNRVEDPAAEHALQKQIHWMLSGNNVAGLETDQWGSLIVDGKKARLRFFVLNEKRQLVLIDQNEQVALTERLRRQTKASLIRQREIDNQRLFELQGANQKLARVEQILKSQVAKGTEERQLELNEAQRILAEAAKTWEERGQGFAEQAERKKTAQAFGQEVRYQLGRLSYPFTLELASACDSFIVRQDDARTVSVFLRVTNLGVPAPKPGKQEAAAAEPETEKADVPETGTETEKASEPAIGFRRAPELSEDDVFLGSVEGERVPIKCFGNAIALFGKWKPSESAKANIRLVRSNLTSDDLESFNGQGLYVFRQGDLIIAHEIDEQYAFERFGTTTLVKKPAATLHLKEVTTGYYEFTDDGSIFRQRLVVPEKWDRFRFHRTADDYIRIVHVGEDGGETELGGFRDDANGKAFGVLGDSVAFATTQFVPSEALEPVLNATGSTVSKDNFDTLNGASALYMIRGTELVFARRAQEGQTINEVRLMHLGDDPVFVGRYAESSAYLHILKPDASLFQSRFNFGDSCEGYKAVITNESEISLLLDGSNDPFLGVQGLGHASCVDGTIAFFARKLNFRDGAVTAKLSPDSTLSLEDIRRGVAEEALVVLRKNEVVTLMEAPAGHRFSKLDVAEKSARSEAYLLTFDGETSFVAEITPEGEWQYPKRYGDFLLGYALLDFEDEAKALLFLHGKVIAGVEELTAAAANGRSLALVAGRVTTLKGHDDRLDDSIEDPEGERHLVLLNGNRVVAKMSSRSGREGEVYEAVTFENLEGIGGRFRVWTEGNIDYTEIVGADGKGARYWKYAEAPESRIAIGIEAPEKTWADELQRREREAVSAPVPAEKPEVPAVAPLEDPEGGKAPSLIPLSDEAEAPEEKIETVPLPKEDKETEREPLPAPTPEADTSTEANEEASSEG